MSAAAAQTRVLIAGRWVTPGVAGQSVAAFDGNGVKLGVPSVTVAADGRSYSVAVTVETNKAVTLAQLATAVRGPAGSGAVQDTSPQVNVALNTTATTLTFSGSATVPGTWTAYARYSLTAGSWIDGPKTTFSIR